MHLLRAPFHFVHTEGFGTWTRNITEYTLVLAQCLVITVRPHCSTSQMQPIATDVVCRSSVCLSVSLSVDSDRECAKSAELMKVPLGIWTRVVQGTVCYTRVQIPSREGALFVVEWRLDFPALRRARFPVALMSRFPHMLSSSIPVGWVPKQSSVTLNFPNKKSPCDVARGVYRCLPIAQLSHDQFWGSTFNDGNLLLKIIYK